MTLRWRLVLKSLFFILCLARIGDISCAEARDAAFINPGTNFGNKAAEAVSDAVVVEPKAEIDTGDSAVNVARRTTLFFANKTNTPVEVVGVTTNDDLNVKSSVVSDDCSKEGKIAPGSRCIIVVETTPTTAGSWTAEVLLTHKGAGRIARAKLIGKAGSASTTDKKDSGFALSTKEVKPIDFGTVAVGDSKIVRTALMINDSPEDISLVSIDVIAAENGLERLDQGCVVDMELKPGESCPVTLMWSPQTKGVISTDLIIRHTGKLGFAVIPIRGIAEGTNNSEQNNAAETKETKTNGNASAATKESTTLNAKNSSVADTLQKTLADRIPPLSSDTVPAGRYSNGSTTTSSRGGFHLIGTVGNRAILLKPDGTTSIHALGDEIPLDDGTIAKLTNIRPKSAEIFVDGRKEQLFIGPADQIISQAKEAKDGKKDVNKGGNKKQSDSSSSMAMERP